MADSFADIWRKVRLHCPMAGALLARSWVQDAYNRLCDVRGWTWLRGEVHLTTLASRSITVSVTNGSTSITSAAAFVSTDVGRQFRVGSFPVYTIVIFVSANEVLLDQVYSEDTSASTTGTIQDIYVTCPADFGRFEIVADPYNQRRMAWWVTADELNLIDPTRTSTDATPRLLATASPSPVSTTLGQIRYEWWPAPTTAKAFPALYIKRPQPLQDTDLFTGVLSSRGDLLELGALAAAARWPGTEDKKNPYFNLQLASQLKQQFDEELHRLTLRDDDQVVQSWSTIPWHRWSSWELAYDTRLLRSTDASIADYAFGANYPY